VNESPKELEKGYNGASKVCFISQSTMKRLYESRIFRTKFHEEKAGRSIGNNYTINGRWQRENAQQKRRSEDIT
jgi:hypothetical protein